MEDKLIVKNGYLYSGDKRVALEFGNLEQIKVLREYAQKVDSLCGDGLQVKPYYEVLISAHVDFQCLCGRKVSASTETDDEDDPSPFTGDTSRCRECNRQYAFVGEEFGNLYVLLKNKNEVKKQYEAIF